jgi:hypothetical protein
MNVLVRRAERKDCVRLLELIQELADYEKAPQEVTVTLAHFEESGFGEKPVWWAFVAEIDGKVEGWHYTISATVHGKGNAFTSKIF